MDAYLDIAANVLRTERRPLSPRAILAAAHSTGLVPSSLYGKAQHKTLSARISEDIVSYRDKSRFFRTDPGKFFLREFLEDVTIPEEYRQPRTTRRRIRGLVRGPVLAIQSEALHRVRADAWIIRTSKILSLLRKNNYAYLDPKKPADAVFVRSFVCVRRGSKILSYRLGRYRDDRDTFMHKRSIGFSTLVHLDEHTLFDVGDKGIVEAGVRAVKIDLDIPAASGTADTHKAVLLKFLWVEQPRGGGDLLAIISFKCPAWFEPLKRRLSINGLEWIDTNGINNVEDFDPWSQRVLEAHHASRILAGNPRD